MSRLSPTSLALAGALALAALTAPAGAAPPTGTLSIQVDVAAYSSSFPEGLGGEFQIASLTGDVSALATMDPVRRAGGTWFQTFCSQFAEPIVPGVQYTWTLDVNLNGNPATPLLNTTAFLFDGFSKGTLPGYIYATGPARTSSAKSLQLALWFLQGQIQSDPAFVAHYVADPVASQWVAYAQANAGPGIGDVRVLVVTENGEPRQDLFAMVPPPPTGHGVGYTPGFWHNKGCKLIDAADVLALKNLNLVLANGSAFDPTTKNQICDWINTPDAVNMAAKLSSHLAAMKLNTLNGFVNLTDLVYCKTSVDPSGKISIGNLMLKANIELGLHPTTYAGSPFRQYQEDLKDALDKANNNLNWV